MRLYRLTYEASPGGEMVVWQKTLDELLVPNGTDSLLVWMLRTAEERGHDIKLEVVK